MSDNNVTRQHAVGSVHASRVGVGRHKETTRSSKVRHGFHDLGIIDVDIKSRNHTLHLKTNTRDATERFQLQL